MIKPVIELMNGPKLDANNNGEIELIEIYRFVQYYCVQASKMKNYTNEEKHNIVLAGIKKIVPLDIYEMYEPMINASIKFIWSLIKSKKCFKSFC